MVLGREARIPRVMAHMVADVAPAEVQIKIEEKPTLTPPASEGTDKHYDSGSELSDLEAETIEKPDDNIDGDIGEIAPDHYYEGGKVPVFKPVRASCTHSLDTSFSQ